MWFTGLSEPGRRRSPSSSAPRSRSGRDRRVSGRRRRAYPPLEGPRVLQGGPRHEHRAHRLGRLAAHRGTAPRCSSRPSPRTRRRVARLVRWWRSSGRSSRSSSRPQSNLRATGRERSVREGVLRRDQGVHRRLRSLRGARGPRSWWSTPRARRPRRAPIRGGEARGARASVRRSESLTAVAEANLIRPHGGELVDRTGERPEGVDELETVRSHRVRPPTSTCSRRAPSLR